MSCLVSFSTSLLSLLLCFGLSRRRTFADNVSSLVLVCAQSSSSSSSFGASSSVEGVDASTFGALSPERRVHSLGSGSRVRNMLMPRFRYTPVQSVKAG